MQRMEIIPNIGVGQIRFGMAREEVISILGPAEDSGKNSEGEVSDDWPLMSVRYSKNTDEVVEIALRHESGVIYNGRTYVLGDELLEELLKSDSSPQLCLGFLLFLDLGIALTGVHDNDSEQLALSVFSSGRWDFAEEHFQSYNRKL